MKYELTNETKEVDGVVLHRIRALRDVRLGVAKGDLGGWVQSGSNLSQEGTSWVFGNAQVSGDAWVFGNAWVYDNAWVFGDARVFGNAQVYGNAQVSGDAWVFGNAWVYDNAWVFGNAWVYDNAQVCGRADVIDYVKVRWGAWGRAPLFMRGTRDPVSVSGPDTLTIGCETHTVEEWLQDYRAIGEKHGYSLEEVEEYATHIRHAAEWLNHALAKGYVRPTPTEDCEKE